MKKYLHLIGITVSTLLACKNELHNTQRVNGDKIEVGDTISSLLQDSIDSEFIRSEGKYVRLIDTLTFPNSLRAYNGLMIEHLKTINLDVNRFFIDTTDIRIEGAILKVPLYHSSGFVKSRHLKELNEQSIKNAESSGENALITVLCGNMSGVDGWLEIDKKQRSVTYGIWN